MFNVLKSSSSNNIDSVKKELSNIGVNVKSAFKTIREEFEDHLDAINENTNEIQANYEHMCELESKVEKVNARLDEIQLMLNQILMQKVEVVDSVRKFV